MFVHPVTFDAALYVLTECSSLDQNCYGASNDPVDAAIFASCAASFCVGAEGVTGIATRGQIDERLRQSRNS